jgi:hypothetical protein
MAGSAGVAPGDRMAGSAGVAPGDRMAGSAGAAQADEPAPPAPPAPPAHPPASAGRLQISPQDVAGISEAAARLNMFPAGRRDAALVGNFSNLSHEWRRWPAEVVGAFLLVVAGAGGAVVAAKLHSGEGSAALAVPPGLTVMVVILFMGAVSGAHLNPVVSVAFALRHEFPWRRVPVYIVAQVLGAVMACSSSGGCSSRRLISVRPSPIREPATFALRLSRRSSLSAS